MTPPDAEALFRAFVAASQRAQTTHALADGLAAGRAWAAFLTAFDRERRRGGAPAGAVILPFCGVRRPGGSS